MADMFDNIQIYIDNLWLSYPLLALIGACFGSYVTLLSYRLPRDLPTVAVRSRCPSCQMALGLRDLIPVCSYLLSQGKCRGCHSNVSLRYPITELVTAAGFIWAFAVVGPTLLLLPVLGLWVCLMTLIVTDLEHYIIPDQLQWAIALLGLSHVLMAGDDLPYYIEGGLLGGLIGLSLRYGFLYLRGKDGLGMGDVKLMAVSGLWLGVEPITPYLFYAGILGVMTAVLWRCVRKGTYYPFGPSLALSLWLLVLYPQANTLFWDSFRQLA